MYKFVRFIFIMMFKLIFKRKVIGSENIPKTGGVIIVANHISLWDPPLLGVAVSRNIHFMAKKELFDIPILGLIIKLMNAFPVNRQVVDRNAIRKAINLLNEGKIIGLFPEGKRNKTGKLSEPKSGLAFIAAKTGATIIPTALIGSNKVLSRKKIIPRFIVSFGKPIFVKKGETNKETLKTLTYSIMNNIQILLENK